MFHNRYVAIYLTILYKTWTSYIISALLKNHELDYRLKALIKKSLKILLWLSPVHSTPVTCYSLLVARNKLNPDRPRPASSLWSSHSEHRNYITLASQCFPPHLQTFLVANNICSISCSLTQFPISWPLSSVQLNKEEMIRLKNTFLRLACIDNWYDWVCVERWGWFLWWF